MKYSSLVERLQGRRTSAWEIHRVAQQAAANGEDVIVLSVGDPDFATPAPIVERAIDALRSGDTHYSAVSGREPVRAAIAEEHARMTGCEVSAANVILTAGAQNGVFAASLCLLEAGDEVIVPEPMYLTYEACVRAAGATLVPVPVDPARAFHVDCDALEAAITPRTKAIFFATPCNPTGVVMQRADLERIARLACEHDLWVLADEVYAELTFERDHVSIASLPGMAQRTVTLGSLSKSHAMAGWRVGWAIGPAELIEHMGRLALAMLYGLPGFIQQAALTAVQNKSAIAARNARDLPAPARRGVRAPASRSGFALSIAGGRHVHDGRCQRHGTRYGGLHVAAISRARRVGARRQCFWRDGERFRAAGVRGRRSPLDRGL